MRTALRIVVLLAASGQVLAQNALDKPLDRNPRIGGNQMNPARPDLAQELRLRNAIVTGNVPGGLSFRGDVGYLAPGEFFGTLGSNDTFSFRRDSYYSGLGGLGIRGTDALQYQFAMTTGNAPPPGFSAVPTLTRAGSAVPALPASGEKIIPIQRAIGEPGTAPGFSLTSLMSLRSPSAFAASRSLEPMVLARQTTREGGTIGVTASPLLGLSLTQRAAEEKPPPANAVNPRTKPEQEEPANRDESKIESSVGKSAYDELLERLQAGGRTDELQEPQTVATWREQLEALRKELGTSPTRAAERPKPPTLPGEARPVTPGQPGGIKPGEVRPGEGAPGEARPATTPAGALDAAAIERIRNAGGDVHDLAAKGFDAYSEHMRLGQEHMEAGRFFFAEERFTAALSAKPGDPMAAIGRIHAQLGAGMLLSAAINLRALFTEHPEVVSLRYEARLLPTPERIGALQERLAELAALRDGKHRDLGLLTAYLAYQSGNAALVKKGLSMMAEAPADPEQPGPDQLQKLAEVLTKVWIPPVKQETGPEAKPAPAPPEPSK